MEENLEQELSSQLDLAQWLLVRCPSCEAILRVKEQDFQEQEVIACRVCHELFRTS